MLNLLHAEWKKMVGHGMIFTFTALVFPFGALCFIIILTLLGELTGDVGVVEFQPWTVGMTNAWQNLTGMLSGLLTRLLIIVFAAVFFAGEYQWQTWKNIVPRRRRAALITSKFVMTAWIYLLCLGLMTLIWGVGMSLSARFSGIVIGPAFSFDVLIDFLPEYLLEAALATVLVWILTGFAALAVLLTRSLAGGILLGCGFSLVESVFPLVMLLLASILDRFDLLTLYLYTPSYSLENIRSWALTGEAFLPQQVPGLASVMSLTNSLLILGAWVVGLLVLAVLAFRRQDLAS